MTPPADPGGGAGGADGPGLILPDRPHFPGLTPRPAEALFAPLKAALLPGMTPADLLRSRAFAEGLRLIEAGYFWEAHELLEAVWMPLPPAGAERVLLSGLIQLANAGLKRRMGREAAALRILALAEAALAEARRRGADPGPALSPARLDRLRAGVQSIRPEICKKMHNRLPGGSGAV